MNSNGKSSWSAKKLVGLALFTAIIVVLQLLGSFIRFGMFSISLVLVPMVVGAAMYGPVAGAYLGAVFGGVVLLSGDASAFLAVNPFGTIVTVMLKGICAGLAAGLVYGAIEKKNRFVAILCAAVVCPVVNTGIFLLGCLVFFMETVAGWGEAMGFGDNVAAYMFLGLAGGNFLFELGVDIILSSGILRLVNLIKKPKKA